MKKLLCALCLALLCGVGAGAVEIWVDGAPVAFPDAQPFVNESGRTLVPLRPVAEKLGLTVEWDAVEKTAVFSRRYTPASPGLMSEWAWEDNLYCDRTLAMTAGGNFAEQTVLFQPRDGGEEQLPYTSVIEMDAAPVIREGRVCAPVRALAEQFFCAVGWNAGKRRVEIETDTLADLLLSERYGARFDWSEGDRDGWTCKLYFDQTPPQWSVSYELDCTITRVQWGPGGAWVSLRQEPAPERRQLRALTAAELGNAAWGVRITPAGEKAADEKELFCRFALRLEAGDGTQYTMQELEYLDNPAFDYAMQVYEEYDEKRRERGKVPLNEQARVLESLGIKCPPAKELREMARQQDEWVRQMKAHDPEGGWDEMRYESPGYAYIALLNDIGGGNYDETTYEFLGYSSDQVWSFDWEQMEVNKMYTELLGELERLSGGELQFTDVTEDLSRADQEQGAGIRSVSFRLNGRPYTCEMEYMGDFMDGSVFHQINKILKQEGIPKRYLLYDGISGGLLLYNTEEWAHRFEEETLLAPSF